jgi:hypothetical protein
VLDPWVHRRLKKPCGVNIAIDSEKVNDAETNIRRGAMAKRKQDEEWTTKPERGNGGGKKDDVARWSAVRTR